MKIAAPDKEGRSKMSSCPVTSRVFLSLPPGTQAQRTGARPGAAAPCAEGLRWAHASAGSQHPRAGRGGRPASRGGRGPRVAVGTPVAADGLLAWSVGLHQLLISRLSPWVLCTSPVLRQLKASAAIDTTPADGGHEGHPCPRLTALPDPCNSWQLHGSCHRVPALPPLTSVN